jgi:hypothetical protein
VKIISNVETANEIKKIITGKTDQPNNVRVYVAGMG